MLVRMLGAALFAIVCMGTANAADPYPTRLVRIIVNTAPGGLTDVVTRLVAQRMAVRLGQPVIVENRPGGDGLLGIRAVKSAQTDGYTLLATAGTIAIQPAVKQDPGYDLLKDFTPVGPMIRSPLLMLVAANQPDKNLADFVTRAKAQPESLSYASAGVGTTTHIGAAMFLRQNGIDLLHVPYKGNGAAMPDVMSGRVNMIFEAYGSSVAKLKAGQVRALGVTSTQRLPTLPDIPTIAEQGSAGYSYYLYLCLLSPVGTSTEVVQRLSETLRAVLAGDDLRERFRDEGAEVMLMAPDEFAAFLKRDLIDMQKIVTDLGLTKQ